MANRIAMRVLHSVVAFLGISGKTLKKVIKLETGRLSLSFLVDCLQYLKYGYCLAHSACICATHQ